MQTAPPRRSRRRRRRSILQRATCLLCCALWLALLEGTTAVAAVVTQPPVATVGPARITPTASYTSSASSAANEASSASQPGALAHASAAEVAAILSKVGATPCALDTRATVAKLFTVNAMLLDACLKESGYLLFPYAGFLPRPSEVTKVCASPSCMDLLSGVVLAKVPECDYDAYSPRSLAETLFRVRVDLANARSPPSVVEFRDQYALNRVVNVLLSNATLQARVQPSFSVAAVAQAMNPAEINPDVVLGANAVIYVQAPSTSGSNANVPGSNSSKPSATIPKAQGSRHGSLSVSDRAPGASSAPSAVTESHEAEASEGARSVAYFFIGFAWLVFNGSYFFVMSSQD